MHVEVNVAHLSCKLISEKIHHNSESWNGTWPSYRENGGGGQLRKAPVLQTPDLDIWKWVSPLYPIEM